MRLGSKIGRAQVLRHRREFLRWTAAVAGGGRVRRAGDRWETRVADRLAYCMLGSSRFRADTFRKKC